MAARWFGWQPELEWKMETMAGGLTSKCHIQLASARLSGFASSQTSSVFWIRFVILLSGCHELFNCVSLLPWLTGLNRGDVVGVMTGGHIAQCLGGILAGRATATVAVYGHLRLTGADFVDRVWRLAAGLSERGVRPGDVVTVVGFNSMEYMELLLAIPHIGAIIAPLNHRWSFAEAAQAVELVRPSAFIFDGSYASWALRLAESGSFSCIGLYLLLGEPGSTRHAEHSVSIEHIKRSSSGDAAMEPVSNPRDVALICFTSGTTGRPKGVAISNTSLIIQSLAKITIVGYGEDDVYLHTAPLCHIGGISSCLAILMAGGCHVLLPKFDAKAAFKAIQEHKVTSFITVPTIMADLLSYAQIKKIPDCGTVTKILNGGGGLSDELIQGASHLFFHAAIFSAYGMTEACSSLTFTPLNKPQLQETKNQRSTYSQGACVGRPAPHVEIRINRDDSNSSSSTVGSILTRGLHTMVGYWANNGVNTSESVRNGWLDTGDTGWIDKAGNLWLMGRQKGRIKSGGENVYPEEVELVLSQHPGVAKVAVFGVPDSRLGEKVVACVCIRDAWKWVDARADHQGEGNQVSAQILQHHCRIKNLSRFKVPRLYYHWKGTFPVTTTGKIRREELKAQILACMQPRSNL